MDRLQAKFMDLEKGIFSMLLAVLLTLVLPALIEIFALIGQVLTAFSILTVVFGFTIFSLMTFGFLAKNKPLLRLNKDFKAVEGLQKG